MENIRNFSIIAHIDHGKSTLSDRFLEITGLKDPKQKRNERILDTLDLEQEKGITIKLQPVRMDYNHYVLNLIDTPGHVDFGYEVSRSLKACEGAILLVDATQGVQAQTLSTMNKAKGLGLKIIPVLNKIDSKHIDINKRKQEFHDILGFSMNEILLTSAKTGEGSEQILTTIIENIPAPTGNENNPLQALIFDSFYDEHKGVVVAVRLFEGKLTDRNKQLHLLKADEVFNPKEIGFFKPDFTPTKTLTAGEVGYIATGLKNIKLFTVGDTISDSSETTPMKGYHPPKPKIFATLFPTNPDDFPLMSESITKLSMNDAALTIAQQKSTILGSGYVCGFLGMLHMEIIQERLEREYELSLIITAPSVEYKVKTRNGKEITIQSANQFPDPSQIEQVFEPWVELEIYTPQKHIGVLMKLCQNNRGIYKDTNYFSGETSSINYTVLKYEVPLISLITGFFSRLKSISHGYASLDYKIIGFRPADIVKISILVNSSEVSSLSFLEIRDLAVSKSRKILTALKETIPRHQFKIALQAAIGGKIIARENISALGKNVTAKLYGGDITRKKKLLERQKKGKKRLREIGGVNIPQKAFLAVVTS